MRYEANIDLALIGKVQAKIPAFQRKLSGAIAVARREIAQAKHPYVSVSGGKDSIAVLGVAAEAAHQLGREIVAWAHVSDASFPGTEQTISDACEIVGVKVYFDRSPVSAFSVYGHGGREKYGKEGYFFSAIREWLLLGYDLTFTGVRAAESKRRMAAAKAHGLAFNTTVPAPTRKCEPLAWWSIEDVAGAIHAMGLPLHPIYSMRRMSEVPIRLGYVTAADWMADQAQFLRLNYPEQFRRLASVAPEVRDYV